MRKTVLVTGGAGFIGSHVCKALAKDGFMPITFDDLVHGHRDNVRWGPLEVGDLRNPEAVRGAFKIWNPIAVVHMAGYIAAGESVANPAKYYDNNMRGTLTLLDAMIADDTRRVVFSSSAAVYGAPKAVPITEASALNPTNPYGHTKLMTEQILRDFRAHGISSTSLRYFNAAGADPEGELGEAHEPETHLIPILLDAAAGLRKSFSIYGDSYRTPDGTCVRDYVHVSDLAKAHVLALKHLDDTSGANAYNLGNGRGYSVREVVSEVEAVTGRPIDARVKPPRPGDPPELVADPGLAEKELGWEQNYADLSIQIDHAWHWHLKAKGLHFPTSPRQYPKTPEPMLATD